MWYKLVCRNYRSATVQGLIDKAAAIVGSQSQLAKLIGVSQQNISYWRGAGVPVEHCAAIEIATEGAVTRRDLRPDDWQKIWPELADSEPDQPFPSAGRSSAATEAIAICHPAPPQPAPAEAAATFQPGA